MRAFEIVLGLVFWVMGIAMVWHRNRLSAWAEKQKQYAPKASGSTDPLAAGLVGMFFVVVGAAIVFLG